MVFGSGVLPSGSRPNSRAIISLTSLHVDSVITYFHSFAVLLLIENVSVIRGSSTC